MALTRLMLCLCAVILTCGLGWFFTVAWKFAIGSRTAWLIALLAITSTVVLFTQSYICAIVISHPHVARMLTTLVQTERKPKGVTARNREAFATFAFDPSLRLTRREGGEHQGIVGWEILPAESPPATVIVDAWSEMSQSSKSHHWARDHSGTACPRATTDSPGALRRASGRRSLRSLPRPTSRTGRDRQSPRLSDASGPSGEKSLSPRGTQRSCALAAAGGLVEAHGDPGCSDACEREEKSWCECAVESPRANAPRLRKPMPPPRTEGQGVASEAKLPTPGAVAPQATWRDSPGQPKIGSVEATGTIDGKEEDLGKRRAPLACAQLHATTEEGRGRAGPDQHLVLPSGGSSRGAPTPPLHRNPAGGDSPGGVLLGAAPRMSENATELPLRDADEPCGPGELEDGSMARGLPMTTWAGSQGRQKVDGAGRGKAVVRVDELSDVCAICLGKYEAGEDVHVLPCLHIFHTQCLDAWIAGHHCCPYCKGNLNTLPPAKATLPRRSGERSSPRSRRRRPAPRRHRRSPPHPRQHLRLLDTPSLRLMLGLPRQRSARIAPPSSIAQNSIV